MTAYVFLAEGFEEVEALTPVDILRRGGVTVKTVGIGGKTITGAHGIPVGCDIAEEDVIPDEIDMMVLPGGMPGTTHLGESLTIQEGLAYAAQEDLWVAAICAAPRESPERAFSINRRKPRMPWQIHLVEPEGTYLVWLDCSELGITGKELDQFIVDKAGLWLDGGSMFGPSGAAFQRVNIACPQATLELALNKLKAAVEGHGTHL